ncbi:MAG: transketolase-like TK C-terminal-containing protein [Rhodothermales bacterium]
MRRHLIARHGQQAIGIDHFGASAPAEELFEHFGITAQNVAAHVRRTLS